MEAVEDCNSLESHLSLSQSGEFEDTCANQLCGDAGKKKRSDPPRKGSIKGVNGVNKLARFPCRIAIWNSLLLTIHAMLAKENTRQARIFPGTALGQVRESRRGVGTSNGTGLERVPCNKNTLAILSWSSSYGVYSWGCASWRGCCGICNWQVTAKQEIKNIGHVATRELHFREAKTHPRSVGFRSVGFFLDRKNLYKSFSKALIPQKSETICVFWKKRDFLGKFEKNWDG